MSFLNGLFRRKIEESQESCSVHNKLQSSSLGFLFTETLEQYVEEFVQLTQSKSELEKHLSYLDSRRDRDITSTAEQELARRASEELLQNEIRSTKRRLFTIEEDIRTLPSRLRTNEYKKVLSQGTLAYLEDWSLGRRRSIVRFNGKYILFTLTNNHKVIRVENSTTEMSKFLLKELEALLVFEKGGNKVPSEEHELELGSTMTEPSE